MEQSASYLSQLPRCPAKMSDNTLTLGAMAVDTTSSKDIVAVIASTFLRLVWYKRHHIFGETPMPTLDQKLQYEDTLFWRLKPLLQQLHLLKGMHLFTLVYIFIHLKDVVGFSWCAMGAVPHSWFRLHVFLILLPEFLASFPWGSRLSLWNTSEAVMYYSIIPMNIQYVSANSITV